MWRLPLPDIKEAIIKKTKELGDEIVYDASSSSGPKIISCSSNERTSLETEGGKDIKLVPPKTSSSLEATLPSSVVLLKQQQLDLTGGKKNEQQTSELLPEENNKKRIVSPLESLTGDVSSNLDSSSTTFDVKSKMCASCQQEVVPEETSCNNTVKKRVDGIMCRGCKKVYHFRCDSLEEELGSFFSSKIPQRYVCTDCIDCLVSSTRGLNDSHPSSTHHLTSFSLQTDGKIEEGSLKGVHEVIPSREEMKQMIKEVVDDVIRSTITQVISEKVLPSSLHPDSFSQSCHCSSSCSESSSSGGDNKPLPSVMTLDKEAEEESKRKKNQDDEKDLLLLLKSPDVEVKHFASLSSPRTTNVTTSSVIVATSSSCPRHHLKVHSCSSSSSTKQIVSTDDIELKKTEILQLLEKKQEKDQQQEENSRRLLEENERPGEVILSSSSTTKEGEEVVATKEVTIKECNPSHTMKDTMRDTMKDTGDKERVTQEDDDEDDGDYESIRFDRDHLDPKSCLGFANLTVLPPDTEVINEQQQKEQEPISSPLDAATMTTTDRGMNNFTRAPVIKLNQVDLSE